MLNARSRAHIGYNEFKFVGLLPVENRVEQLKLGHTHNIINGSAPEYMKSQRKMVQHNYNTISGDLSCKIIYNSNSILYSALFNQNCSKALNI